MEQNSNKAGVSKSLMATLVIINILILREAFVGKENLYWWLLVSLPLLLLGIYDVRQQKQPILRNYPVIGHLRYLFGSSRTKIGFGPSTTTQTPSRRQRR